MIVNSQARAPTELFLSRFVSKVEQGLKEINDSKKAKWGFDFAREAPSVQQPALISWKEATPNKFECEPQPVTKQLVI